MIKTVIAIDPSMHSTGIAIFKEEVLQHTKRIIVNKKITGFHALLEMKSRIDFEFSGVFYDVGEAVVVIEEQIRRDHDRMSMEDFVKMASISYIIGCEFALPVCFVKPSTWKKSIPKKIHTKRIYDRELELGTKVSLIADMQPDIMDAVGIGRWWYDRRK